MRVTIWQQFSSNHSANFTVVGEFASEADAEQAEIQVQAILDRLQKWWDKFTPDERMEWGKITETDVLTPIEQTLSQELNVAWTYSLNWFHWVRDRDPVTRYERFLFITNPNQIWCGPQPFDELLQKLGAKINLGVIESRTHPDSILLTDITCTLPADKEIAELLVEGLREDFEAYRRGDWDEGDERYNPNFKLPFYVELDVDLDIPRLFEVERRENKLFIWGVTGYWFDSRGYDALVGAMKTVLEDEGCTDVIFAFRSFAVDTSME